MCKNSRRSRERTGSGFVSQTAQIGDKQGGGRSLAIFVANSTYFNHVNLLRKHLLCFSHTITTVGGAEWLRGAGGSGENAQPPMQNTNFNFNLLVLHSSTSGPRVRATAHPPPHPPSTPRPAELGRRPSARP